MLGLFKLARVVDHFARGLQLQERLTVEIADFLDAELLLHGAGVVLEAEHLCMSGAPWHRPRGPALRASRALLRRTAANAS